jgi:myo-inositol 2-dehydrogenase/D-chiro-inositol 1-dehydrogenase
MAKSRTSPQIFRSIGNLLAGAGKPAPAILSGRSPADTIRIGLVGCGWRGTGIISDALTADPKAELVAVADVNPEQTQRCLDTFRRIPKIAGQIRTDLQNFEGLDGYSKLIQSGVDLVVLATPPGFRPAHLAACVDGGKHVFCEKPAATDAAGVQSVLASVGKARAKKLCLMSGLCTRYDQTAKDMFGAIARGEIGRVVAYHSTYFGGCVKPMPPASARPAHMTDLEWQIRNWYNFVWLSGDGLVEQAIHSVDRISWAMGDQPPVSCTGSGGRAVPAPGGNIFDHFSVIYTWSNGMQAVLNTRQIDGCLNGIFEHIFGTEGACVYGRGPWPVFKSHDRGTVGETVTATLSRAAERAGPFRRWAENRSSANMYREQQIVLLRAIRNQEALNDGERLAMTTLLALMGRTAAYTGREITWDEMLKSTESLVPESIGSNDGRAPVARLPQPGLNAFAR